MCVAMRAAFDAADCIAHNSVEHTHMLYVTHIEQSDSFDLDRCSQRRRRLKNVSGAESCNFTTDSCKFPREVMRQISILPINFPPKRGDFNPKFCICRRKFSDKKIYRQFSDRPKCRGGGVAIAPISHVPYARTPLVALKFWSY